MTSHRSFAAGLQHAVLPAAKRPLSRGCDDFISPIAVRNNTETGYITTSSSDYSQKNMTSEIQKKREEIDEMLRQCDNSISDLNEKISKGRVRKPEHERVRCRWHKEKRGLLSTRLDIMEHRDLLELGEKVEKFEELEENRKNNFRLK